MTFPPLMPSSLWMANFLQSKNRNTSEESVLRANESLISTKEFGRFSLRESNGKIFTLSLAVEGGGRQLRTSEKIENLKLSEHGEWRRNHLRAMDACLGKKPFFPYFFPKLTEIYLDRNIATLKDFNTAIFRILYSFIVGEDKNNDFSQFYDSIILQDRGKEIADKIDSGISSLEAMSYFGKESLLGFLAINL